MARKFFYVCAGMLMLALAYHFGASTASAQFGSAIQCAAYDPTNYRLLVVTTGGDVYGRVVDSSGNKFNTPPALVGNFWSGGPTPTQQESWGQLKSRYAPNHVAKPGAVGR